MWSYVFSILPGVVADEEKFLLNNAESCNCWKYGSFITVIKPKRRVGQHANADENIDMFFSFFSIFFTHVARSQA